MEAVTLRHVDKSYTTYGTEAVLTGRVRPSRTRQVLRDVSVSFPAGRMEPVIHIRGVQKSFPGPQGRLPVLQDIDLDVAPAEFITIVGRSGCGKSTLLKLLTGQEQPDAGEVLLPEGWRSALRTFDLADVPYPATRRAPACAI